MRALLFIRSLIFVIPIQFFSHRYHKRVKCLLETQYWQSKLQIWSARENAFFRCIEFRKILIKYRKKGSPLNHENTIISAARSKSPRSFNYSSSMKSVRRFVIKAQLLHPLCARSRMLSLVPQLLSLWGDINLQRWYPPYNLLAAPLVGKLLHRIIPRTLNSLISRNKFNLSFHLSISKNQVEKLTEEFLVCKLLRL